MSNKFKLLCQELLTSTDGSLNLEVQQIMHP